MTCRWPAFAFLLVWSFVSPVLAQATAELISKSTVLKYPLTDPYDRKNFYGFNHAPSITTLPDGRLCAAWFSGPFEASVDQVILGSYSSDGGKTWSPEVVLNDEPRKSDFDPAFIRDGKRTHLFYEAGRWNRYPVVGRRTAEEEQVGVKSYRMYMRTSDDSGMTWSAPVQLSEDGEISCRSNGIRLTTGELLFPIQSKGPVRRSGVLKSSDGGKSWKRFGDVGTPEKIGAAEPTIAELSDGRVLMAVRTSDGFLWTAIGTERGEKWGEARKTEIVAAGSSSNLLRLADGRILLTHSASPPPLRSPLTVRVSNDGEAWGPPLKVDEVPAPEEGGAVWGRSVTYPSACQLEDGTVVIVWAKIEAAPDSQWGIIESARLRVP
jgi:sialidase-1